MLSACCCTVSPTTSSTCFACSYLRRCAQHRSKRCAFSCSRSERASAKQLVASAFTWPADGLFRISSKPSATPLRLSRRSDNSLSRRNQAELSGKTVREVKTTATHTCIKVAYGARSFPPPAMRFLRYDSRADELTRLVGWIWQLGVSITTCPRPFFCQKAAIETHCSAASTLISWTIYLTLRLATAYSAQQG